MWLTILAHGGGIGWDELALIIVAGLFVILFLWVMLGGRHFKPIMDEDAQETEEPAADSEEQPQ